MYAKRDMDKRDMWTREDSYFYETHLCVHLKRPMYVMYSKREIWINETYGCEKNDICKVNTSA